MPQLDFREALSTPEEKHFSPVLAAAVPAAVPLASRFSFLARALRLTRSTWANIIFVTIASAGGLFCAFYFFNGAEVLRAAASWPSEFLYPRPASVDVVNAIVQPNPVDTFTNTTGTDADKSARKGPFDQNGWPSDLTQPPVTTSPLTAPGVFNDTGFVIVPSGPGSTIFSTIDSTIEGLNLLPPGGDALFQSIYQTAIATATATTTTTTTTVKKTVRSTVGSTRRKTASTTQKTTSVTGSSTSSASSTVRSTTQNMQQTTLNQTQVGGMNTIQAPNQTMIGGGLGGVNGVGGVNGTVGGLGGVGGGILGGLGGHH